MITVRYLEHFRARRTEWLLAFVSLTLGITYLVTPGLFEQPAYELMLRHMSQTDWGITISVLASVRLAMLAINGGWSVSPHFRVVGAFLTAGLWLVLFLSQNFVDAPHQTRFIWLIFMLFDLIGAGDAAADAGHSEALRRERKGAARGERAF